MMFYNPNPTPTYGPGTANVPMFPAEYNEFLAPISSKTAPELGPRRRTTYVHYCC